MTRRTLLISAATAAVAAAQKKPDQVAGEHAAIGIADGPKPIAWERTKHPDAQWYPDAGLGLFIHWGMSTVQARYGISWPMIAGRELGQRRLTPDEIKQVIENRAKDELRMTCRSSSRPQIVSPRSSSQ